MPGWKDRPRSFHRMAEFLAGSGWPPDRVVSVSFEDPFESSIAHAAELAAVVDDVLRHCPGTLHIVAHSMGGLATRWFLHEYPAAAAVRRVVFLATPHNGTWSAWMAWGEGAREMRPGSPFLRRLAERPLPGHVQTFTVRTPIDTHVVPGRHATLDGATNVLVRMPTHRGLLRNARVFEAIRGALLQPDQSWPPG